MSFGQLVPGMAPMPIPPMLQQNQMLKQGMGILQASRGAQKGPPQPGQPMDLAAPGMPSNGPPGLLQRLLAGAGGGGAPTDGAAAPGPMGMLGKLFPGLAGQQQPQAPAPVVPPDALGGLY